MDKNEFADTKKYQEYIDSLCENMTDCRQKLLDALQNKSDAGQLLKEMNKTIRELKKALKNKRTHGLIINK